MMATEAVTAEDLLNACNYRYTAHYNMGGAGYRYEFTCVEHPRVKYVDSHYRPARSRPGKSERTWYVDGVAKPTLELAAEALATPPVLTDDERRILEAIPSEFTPLRALEDELAGVERPCGGIMPDTPHSRVMTWLKALKEKGMIECGRNPERDDGRPWFGGVPDHLRWTPTVRRCQQPGERK